MNDEHLKQLEKLLKALEAKKRELSWLSEHAEPAGIAYDDYWNGNCDGMQYAFGEAAGEFDDCISDLKTIIADTRQTIADLQPPTQPSPGQLLLPLGD